MSDLDRSEFAAGYLLEADEHVRSAIANLLAIEQALRQGGPQHRLVRELFRSLHTLKGLSAMVGVDAIVDIAHEMETILRDLDRGGAKLSAESVELLLQGVRAIELRVAAFAQGQNVPVAPRALIEALAGLQTPGRDAPAARAEGLTLDPELLNKLSSSERDHLSERITAGARALRVDFYPSPERAAAGFSITSVREHVAELGEIVKVIPRAVPKNDSAPGGLAFALIVLSEADDERIARAASTDSASLTPITFTAALESADDWMVDSESDDPVQLNRSSIRVEVSRLDDALEKLSALVVTRFKVTHAVSALRERGVDVRELSAILGENQRQLRDLRRAITRARMVSVAELLERVPLIVRGMKRTTGKQVRLVIDAGKAELDKAVAERVFPAIVHLVRNAIDHAIEAPEERAALGKSPEGTVTVSCFEHSDTQLEVRVSDDGRGIDAAAVSRRASRAQPQPSDARGLLDLITLPGLSTLAAATSNSGRGMGMDIVRRIAVELLGGELSLQTTPGRGSAFTMRLPLSVSILDSLSFVCGPQSFAVPMAMVDEIIDLDSEHILQAPAPRARANGPELRLLERRGEAIPLYGLAALLQLKAAPTGRGKAFIIRPQGQALAFAIDRVLGQHEIVVRPVADPLVQVPGVAGTTDLGDGQPTLVLDLVGLSQVALKRSAEVRA
jgi:two-component system chemotaxis sensor kinase CheA